MEADTGTEVEAQAEVVKQSTPVTGPSRLALFIALLALVAVAIGLTLGYRYWQQIQQSLEQLDSALVQTGRDQATLRERLSQTAQSFQEQQQMIATQDRQLAEQRQQWEREREAMRQQGMSLNHTLIQMQRRLGGKVSLWQVAEAEYLLRLANHRLVLMADPATALTALTAADALLRETGDAGWMPTLEVLAQEMAALQAVPAVDTGALHTRLAGLSEQVDDLPLQQASVQQDLVGPQERAGQTPVNAEPDFSLRQVADDLWRGFKSLVVIRHRERPLSAILPPDQRYFLLQNLHLKLEAAKTALIGRDATLYRESLLSSAAWLQHYFVFDAPEVQAFHSQLIALAEEEIAPALPDISAPLRLLQARLDEVSREEVSE